MKKKIEKANTDYAVFVRDGNYAKASEVKYGVLVELEKKLHDLEKMRLENSNKLIKEIVDDKDIACIVAKWTGIPVCRIVTGKQIGRAHV